MKNKRGYLTLVLVLCFLVGLNVFFFFVSPEEIVKMVGIGNTYFVIFAISVLGGLSTVTGAALFTAIVTFSVGGADPLLLGLAGGSGIFISDSIFYFLIYHGRKSVPHSWEKFLERIEIWIAKYPPKAVLTCTYIYLSFTPLPNDILMAALVLGGYEYKKIAPVLALGSFTVALLTAYLGGFILG